MRDVIFKGSSFDDFIFGRIVKLVEEVRRTPFEGSGKPEPLKHQLKGFWSRRITSEHRLVYKATDTTIEIISCKYHY
jgi:toxin YoeB